MATRPAGTGTYLFTDIEESPRLFRHLEAQAYEKTLDNHQVVLRNRVRGELKPRLSTGPTKLIFETSFDDRGIFR